MAQHTKSLTGPPKPQPGGHPKRLTDPEPGVRKSRCLPTAQNGVSLDTCDQSLIPPRPDAYDACSRSVVGVWTWNWSSRACHRRPEKRMPTDQLLLPAQRVSGLTARFLHLADGRKWLAPQPLEQRSQSPRLGAVGWLRRLRLRSAPFLRCAGSRAGHPLSVRYTPTTERLPTLRNRSVVPVWSGCRHHVRLTLADVPAAEERPAVHGGAGCQGQAGEIREHKSLWKKPTRPHCVGSCTIPRHPTTTREGCATSRTGSSRCSAASARLRYAS